jgi:8-oxo-dGTP diphosphatase
MSKPTRRTVEQAVERMLREMAEQARRQLHPVTEGSLFGHVSQPVVPAGMDLDQFVDFLRRCHVYEFPKADNTTDAVLFGLLNDELVILLIMRGRENEPFYGFWALPGGFLNLGEDLDACVRRELEEETHVKLSYLEQLYTFGRPDRDPRGYVISTAYLALVSPDNMKVEAADDARKAEWFPVKNHPALAFDHAEIVRKGLERLRSKVRGHPIGLGLLPEEFSLGMLQRLYEVILGHSIDKRNFRRQVLKSGLLIDTETNMASDRGPAGKLYRFDRERYKELQAMGIDFEVG